MEGTICGREINANAGGIPLPTGVANPGNNPRVPLWGGEQAGQGKAARGRGQGAREGGQGGPASCKLHGKVYTIVLWVEESGA